MFQWKLVIPLSERTCICPVLSLITNVPIKAFLGVLGQIYFWQGFSFPNLMPGCSSSSSAFPPGHVSLLPPSGSCLFVFSLSRSSLFILRGLLSPDFLFVGMLCSGASSPKVRSCKLELSLCFYSDSTWNWASEKSVVCVRYKYVKHRNFAILMLLTSSHTFTFRKRGKNSHGFVVKMKYFRENIGSK